MWSGRWGERRPSEHFLIGLSHVLVGSTVTYHCYGQDLVFQENFKGRGAHALSGIHPATLCSPVSKMRSPLPPEHEKRTAFARFLLSSGTCGRVAVLGALTISLATGDKTAKVMRLART